MGRYGVEEVSGLLLPKKLVCMAFRCPQAKTSPKEHDFCAKHWQRIPTELAHEYLGARREAQGREYITGRMKTAYGNIIQLLAKADFGNGDADFAEKSVIEVVSR